MAATSPRKEIFTGEMLVNWMTSPHAPRRTLLRDQIDLGSDSAGEGKETSSNQGCDCCYCNSKSHVLIVRLDLCTLGNSGYRSKTYVRGLPWWRSG